MAARNNVTGGGFVLVVVAMLGAMVLVNRPPPEETGSPYAMLARPPKCPSVITHEVEHIICGLPMGVVAFNAPTSMTLKKPHVISLMLTGRDSVSFLSEQVKTITGDSVSKITLSPVKVSSRMLARLEGQGFDITPKASEAAPVAVSTSRRSEWTWQVTPIAEGEQLLILTLDAVIRLRSGDVPHPQTVFRRRIQVEVTALDYVRRFGTWLVNHWVVLAALATLAIALYRLYKAKRRKVGFG